MTIKIDSIIKTRRKTLAIIVKRDGTLMVRAPMHASNQTIQNFVEEKSEWIRSKQQIAKNAYAKIAGKKFINGESFLFLGNYYPLKIIDKSKEPLILDGEGFKLAYRYQNQAARVFEKWYKVQAHKVISERCLWYAQKYGFTYKRLRISSAETRWGSCSTSGTLSFTWRLIMAPASVLDYVIVHELAHTIEHNHGKGFWEKVGNIFPGYKTQIKWLKTNGQILRLE